MLPSDRNDRTFSFSRREISETIRNLVSDWYEIDRRAVEDIGAAVAAADPSKGWQGSSMERSARCAQRDLADSSTRGEVERSACRMSAIPTLPSTLPTLGAP